MRILLAVCLLQVGMSGQSYKSVAYPWCEVVDFSETKIACVMPTGRIVVVPAVAPVLSAPLPDRIPEVNPIWHDLRTPNCGDGINFCTDHTMTLVAPMVQK
jgi:hypothetical protein